MAEVAFAKQFLSTLDSRPAKLPSDYIADPRQLPAQPAHILPRISKPYPSRSQRQTLLQQTAPTADLQSISSQETQVTLSPLRAIPSVPGPVTLPIPTIQLGKTSVFDVKTKLSQRTGYQVEKLKILYEKRPVIDSKTLAELDVSGGAVRLQVMYMGAPSSVPKGDVVTTEKEKLEEGFENGGEKMDVDETPIAQGKSGEDVLRTSGFWSELKGFVLQRVRDEEVSGRAVDLWSRAWDDRGKTKR